MGFKVAKLADRPLDSLHMFQSHQRIRSQEMAPQRPPQILGAGPRDDNRSWFEEYRDLLADPLRQLEMLLQRIRRGAFLPDASRSGMVTEAFQEDPSKSFRKDVSASDGSESSSTDSSTATNDPDSDDLPDVFDPIINHEVWNSGIQI